MKRLLMAILLIAVIFDSRAQIVQPKWESCFGGTEWEQGNSVIENSTGYLILGSTESSDGDVQGHHGLSDSWLLQVDTVGNLMWSRSYGGTKGEYGEEILVAGNNQYYLTGLGGSENGDISFDPYPNSMDYWIVKIDSVGDIIWDKILGGNKIDWTRNAKVTNDGGVLTLGISTSDDGDISNPNGSWDLWMIKLNNNGEKLWDFSLGGEGYESGGSIIKTSDQGYIIAGSTDGEGGGNYDSTCNYHGYPGGLTDVWIVKLDSLRNIEWQQCYGGTYLDDGLNILETEDGYVCLAVTMSNDGDVSGFHGVPGNQEYGDDIWVFKIDKQGNLLWQKCLGGLYYEWARNIFPTSDGGFMVVGTTQSDDGDVEGFNGYQAGGYDDVWFAKIDSMGNLTWQYCYGGPGTEYIYRGVHQKSDYNYVLTIGTITDEWQCSEEEVWPSDVRVVELFDTTVGLPENEDEGLSVEVWPNPASEVIHFTYSPGTQSEAVLRLFNQNAILIDEVILEKGSTAFRYNCSNYKAGIYYYSLTAENKIATGKIVVVK